MFNNFKQNEIFRRIIGNDVRSKHIADQYYNKIRNSYLMKDIEKYKSNDLYGSPYLYNYPEIGLISPGTLYFLSILLEINELLLDIGGLNIC
jgi:hypothetical protein